MQNTARGFISHNAADRGVHFSYFGGAKSGDDLVTGLYAWYIDHRIKEKWADYWIIIGYYHNGNIGAAFDPNGCLKFPADYANGIPVASPSTEMAKIMQLAQKVARKNRRFSEAGKDYYVIFPQTLEEITTQVQDKTVTPYTKAKLATLYTRSDFYYHTTMALIEGWSISDLEDKYQEAVNNVKAWQAANP